MLTNQKGTIKNFTNQKTVFILTMINKETAFEMLTNDNEPIKNLYQREDSIKEH